MEQAKRIIKYNGQELETTFFYDLTDEQFNELRNEYYKKPKFEDVINQFFQIRDFGMKNDLITDYYVKDLMAKTKLYHSKWSIEDVFNCKELLGHFYAKTLANDKVYPKTNSIIDNITTAFRLGGKGVASKPSNFPLEVVDDILEQYNINGNWYDFSCGWGARLTGALRNRVNYFGTDPNYLLTARLQQLASDYKKIFKKDYTVDIRTQGSEIFVPEWENTIGLAFSSPPYFYLEDYKIGNQSWKEGTTYKEWQDNYLRPTFINIHRYLVDNGAFILNINNFDKYDLVEDCIKIAEQCGFSYVQNHKLKNIKRINEKTELNDNSETIMVFMKQGHEQNARKSYQVSLFELL